MQYLSNAQTLETKQVMSASQVESLQVLSFNNVELHEFLLKEMIENPVIEYSGNTSLIDVVSFSGDFASNSIPTYDSLSEQDPDGQYIIPDNRPNIFMDDLMLQLYGNVSEADEHLCKMMIECLDESGFFPYTPSEAASFLNRNISDVERCLSTLSSLEPIGVFSYNLSECLIRQLVSMDALTPALRRIIETYWDDFLTGHFGKIKRAENISSKEMQQYIQTIGKLNPRPRQTQKSSEYVLPDLILRDTGSSWELVFNDKWVDDFKYSDYYLNLMHTTDQEEIKEYISEKVSRAKFVFNCVERRRDTVRKIMSAVITHQNDFFRGKCALAPISMRDVAKEIEMHPSTIGRAVNGKYLQYTNGTIPLRNLFSSSAISGDEAMVSPYYVKSAIIRILKTEKRAAPYTDIMIAKKLSEEGILISRRSISKYRNELGVLESNVRRYLPLDG